MITKFMNFLSGHLLLLIYIIPGAIGRAHTMLRDVIGNPFDSAGLLVAKEQCLHNHLELHPADLLLHQ
jgi:hypothetical protein